MIRPELESTARRAAAALALATLLLARPAAAARESGIQENPTGDYIMVSKDVGSERWAMTYDYFSGIVLGNVYSADGGAPKFVACDVLAENENGDLTLECQGNDPCNSSPCGGWTSIGTVNIPGSFFALPD